MPRRTPARWERALDLTDATLIKVADLREFGVPPRTIQDRCRPGGPWQRVLPGVLLTHSAPPTRVERQRAALLYAGSGAVLTGLDGLQRHGMNRSPEPTGPVHVLIPTERRRGGLPHVLVERTERLPHPPPGSLPVAPIQRAGLDFARRTQRADEIRSVLAEIVQRGRCEVDDLRRELAAGSDRGTALPRRILAEISDGVRSVAEAKARILLESPNLPRPLWNPLVRESNGRFVAVPDAWFDDVAMAWEIDSVEFHLSPDDHAKTLDRRSAMMAVGIVVLHTRPSKVSSQPGRVMTELRLTYEQARLRPRPHLIATPARGANGAPAQ